MRTKRSWPVAAARRGFAALLAAALPAKRARFKPARATSAASSPDRGGPEAGVWVIAETNELPTKFVRIVVTDDQGRYLMPDLPKASYDVWVRGYGSSIRGSPRRRPARRSTSRRHRADSARRRGVLPGRLLVLAAHVPDEERVSRHRAAGNGISPT